MHVNPTPVNEASNCRRPISGCPQPVELLTAIPSQATLLSIRLEPFAIVNRLSSNNGLAPAKRAKFRRPRWALPAATASRAKRRRTVELKVGVLCWAERGRVDDGQGGKRKPTREEVRVRSGHRWRLTRGPSSTLSPAARSAAHTSESFSAFLSAAARRASDSLPAPISAR